MFGKALIILLIYAAILNGVRLPAGNGDLRLEQLFLSFCAAAFCLHFIITTKSFRSLPLRKHYLYLLAFWLLLFLPSLLYAPDKKYSLVQSASQVIMTFAFLAMSRFAVTRINIGFYVKHVFIATIGIVLVGIVFFAISFVSGFALYGINLTQNESEAFGIYMTMREPNLWGSYMMGIFFLAIGMLKNKGYKTWGIANGLVQLAMASAAIGILLSFTRGVWLATLIGLALFYFPSLKSSVRNLPRLLLIGAFVLVSFYFLKNVLKLEILSYKLDNFLSTDVGTGEGRVLIWGVALENWLSSGHFLLGNGMYSFASFFNTDSYSNDTNAWIGNLYITLLHDCGLIGLIVFFAFVYSVIKQNKTLNQLPKNGSIRIFLRGVRIAIITTLISFFFTTGLSLSFCWILFGLSIGIRRFAEQQILAGAESFALTKNQSHHPMTIV